MDFPRPSSQWGTDVATNEIGAWHNYIVDLIRGTVRASGYGQRSPHQLKYYADQMQTTGLINAAEKTYLYRYADRLGQHYNESSDTWERGPHYIASLVNDFQSIHTDAATDPAAINPPFKAFNNIARASSEYWYDGGVQTPDPQAVALAGLIASDLFGAACGAIWAMEEKATGWDVVGHIALGAAFGSGIAFFVKGSSSSGGS